MSITRVLASVGFVLAAGTALAQPLPVGPAQAVSYPTVLKRVPPDFPNSCLSARREGWVKLAFIVTAAGEVDEAMVEDSAGCRLFEQAALAALRQWRYAPTSLNGKPIDRSAQTVMRFQLSMGGGYFASKRFKDSFKEVQALLAAKDVARAEELLAALRSEPRRSVYEDAWLYWLEFLYLEATNQPAEQRREMLTKAIGYEIRFLDPELFVFAAERLFWIQADAGDLGGAIGTYERLLAQEDVHDTDAYARVQAELSTTVADMERVIAGDEQLMLRGRVGHNEYWVHTLVRRSFAFASIAGTLHDLSLRCANRVAMFTPVTDESTWTVPESFGDCSVYVKGIPGATFEFYELPKE